MGKTVSIITREKKTRARDLVPHVSGIQFGTVDTGDVLRRGN